MLHIEISIEDDRWFDLFPDYEKRGVEATTAAFKASDKACLLDIKQSVEISLILSNDKRLHALNAQYRGKDKPTNVLSFPAMPLSLLEQLDNRNGDDDKEAAATALPDFLLGDIAISLDRVQQEARAQNKNVIDHCLHLIVHGCLHLLGYDHEIESDAEIMEAAERQALATMQIADPYQPFLKMPETKEE